MLLGDRQHGDRGGRRGRADRDIRAVVLIGFGERDLGEIGLALVVLGDDDDLAPGDRHRALGRVFEAELEAGLGLLGVGLERTGAAINQCDLEIVGSRRRDRRENRRDTRERFERGFHVSPVRDARALKVTRT